jgi:hypothetical protein
LVLQRFSLPLFFLCYAILFQPSAGRAQREPSSGQFDGPAELPRVYVKSALADTPAPGKSILVKTSAELTSALDKAVCGDTIQLQAGATFVGSFKIPAKSCDDQHWIILRTSVADQDLPAEGVRITPCYAGVASLPGRPEYACPAPKNVMAKVVFNDHGSGPCTFLPGANHYRLVGLEITRDAPGAVTYNLVSIPEKATIDHIVWDRVWMHGTAQDETTRGIALGGSRYLAVVDSYFSDFHCVAVTGACGDSQAIAGGIGSEPMGPYKIVNNFLEASGENIILGGGPADYVPSDIEIRHNHMFKPLNWAPGSEGFVGGKSGRPFIVKNLFELKNGQRVLFEGNILENVWGGFTQAGFGILLTPKNPGTCNVCTVRDITIRFSRITHAGAAMQIANGLSDPGFAAREGSHYSIHDLIFDDMAYKNCPGCNRDLFQIGSAPQAPQTFWIHDVSIRHVTVATDRARAAWVIAGPVGQQNMVFQDNIVDSGTSGFINAGGGATQCYFQQEVMKGILDRCWASYKFDHNVIMNAHPAHRWPSDNWPTGGNGQVGFVSWNGGVDGDYHLSAKSRFKKKASDGKDPGADIDAINQATKGAA